MTIKRSEINGWLTIDNDRKTGVYGVYWNITITPEDGSSPVQGTLSEKIWARTGLPSPDSTIHVQATAKLNANDRWNVTSVDAGPKNLTEVSATFIQLDKKISDNSTCYVVHIFYDKFGVIKTHMFQNDLKMFNIISLPHSYTFISDWERKPDGWKLKNIRDQSLLSFFATGNDGLPIATGYPATAWKMDDTTDSMVIFDTDIPGLRLCCKLYAYTLRRSGVCAMSSNDLVKARLSLRNGRWRCAELLEPRPDITSKNKGKKFYYAIETLLAFQEKNESGDFLNWLEIKDDRLDIKVASLSHTKLVEIGEEALVLGACIVCDLKIGKNGWYGSRIHRITDQKMVKHSQV